jgi:hypothetical protein
MNNIIIAMFILLIVGVFGMLITLLLFLCMFVNFQFVAAEQNHIGVYSGEYAAKVENFTIGYGASCDSYCKATGFSAGRVIGTVPFCAASCKDCASSEKCYNNWSEGNGCMTGNKVCCCGGKSQV